MCNEIGALFDNEFNDRACVQISINESDILFFVFFPNSLTHLFISKNRKKQTNLTII